MTSAYGGLSTLLTPAKARGAILLLLGLVATSLLATEVVLYSNNTMMENGRWISGKMLLEVPSMGARNALNTRNLLTQNQLHLQVWHGFNEFTWHEPISPARWTTRFRLEDGAQLCLLFNRTVAGYCAVRMSRNELYPPAFVTALPNGAYTTKRTIPELSLDEEWHEAEIVFTDNGFRCFLDGDFVFAQAVEYEPAQLIGYRSGREAVHVDRVTVADHEGKLLVDEGFDNNRNRWTICGALVLLFLMAEALIFLARFARTRKPVSGLFAVAGSQVSMFLMLLIWFAFDYHYWSTRYPYSFTPRWWNMDISKAELGFERHRRGLFAPFGAHVTDRSTTDEFDSDAARYLGMGGRVRLRSGTLQTIQGPASAASSVEGDQQAEAVDGLLSTFAGSYRVLILGTSQAWGEGATYADDKLASVMHRNLAGLPEFAPYASPPVVFNASQRGSRSGELLERYEQYLHRLQPHLLVLILSNNDGNTEEFENNLEAMLVVAQNSFAAPTVMFVLEARDPGSKGSHIVDRHAVMTEVAGRHHIPIIDLHGYMDKPDVCDSGHLWWDTVHMTSHGQQLAGEFLAREIRPHLPEAAPIPASQK